VVVRILDHYLHGAATSALKIAPGRPQMYSDVTYEQVDPPVFITPVEALAWQEAERRNLRAAVYLAAYEGHYRYAWQLPHHFAHFLLLRGSGRERVEVQSVALAAAHQLGDLRARAEALRGLGSAYMGQDDRRRATQHLGEALGLMRQIGDMRGEASTLGLLGMIARDEYEYDKAMEYFERGVVLMRDAGAPTGVANALHNIGIVHAELGRTEEALAAMRQAAELLTSHADLRSSAMVLHDIAHVHFDAFDDEACLSVMQESLAAYRATGDRRGEALAQADFVYWQYEMGDSAAVRQRVPEVARLCMAYTNLPDVHAVLAAMEDVRDHMGQVAVLVALSLDAQVNGRLTEAIGLVRRCLAVVRSTSRWWSESRLLGQLSTLHLALGDRESAIRYGEEAVAATERLRQPRPVVVAEQILATATAPATPV
jgi:tetratricopeptide (TPR) repeat protein